jgi:Tol biopolymer transport system component
MNSIRMLPILLLATACGDNGKAAPDAKRRVDAALIVDAPRSIDGAPDAPPNPTGANRLWVVGDSVTNDKQQLITFVDGDAAPIVATPFPATGQLPTQPALGNLKTFDVAANGSKIAYLADSTVAGRFDLFVANPDGSNPVSVAVSGVNSRITYPVMSPDGSKVAFLHDPEMTGMEDLYVAPTTAAAAIVKLSPTRTTPSVDLSVFRSFVWSPDSKYVAYSARLTEAGYDEAVIVDTTVATPVSVKIIPRADIAINGNGAQGVRGFAAFDAAGHVYFRARLETGGQFKLYQSKLDGTERTVVIVAPARGDASVANIGSFVTDGNTLVVSADAPTLDQYNLYKFNLGGAAAPVLLTAGAVTQPNTEPAFLAPLLLSPDKSKVAFLADYVGQAIVEPYVSALDGSGTKRLTVSTLAGTDADTVAWSGDSTSVYATMDIAVSNEVRLIKLNASMSDQAAVTLLTPPTNGDVSQVFAAPKR